jgi:hypothetical protein
LCGGDRQQGHSPDSRYFRSAPKVRPLPSTDVIRLPRYYEPVRHPTRPGLSLAGVRLRVTRSRRWGFPCCVDLPCAGMPSPLPRWQRGWGSSRSPGYPRVCGLPHPFAGSAATSNVSRPAQRSLALRPACSRSRSNDPFHRRLRQYRYLHCRSDCYRLERPVAGGELHPLKGHALARRTRERFIVQK